MTPFLVLVTGLQGTGKSTVAESAATLLHAPVLAHDWAMSALRPYPVLEDALDSMEPVGRGVVGWSILCALAQAQLRRGESVVLDGMARTADVERCRRVVEEEAARLAIVVTECTDTAVHRVRIEGRRRDIPNWYELDWDHVQQARSRWQPPDHVDLRLQATDTVEENIKALTNFVQSLKAL